MLNSTAATLAVAKSELPNTVLVAICGRLANSIPLSLSVTQPSVTSNCALSKLDIPFSACVIPVALALVAADDNTNLLCTIPAALLMSAFTITLGLICASTVLAVESMLRLMSPTIVLFWAKSPAPVKVKMSALLPAVTATSLRLFSVKV